MLQRTAHRYRRSVPPSGRRQAGQVLVLVALAFPVLLASMGLAVDMGVGFASHRTAQNTADAATYGGALLIGDNNPNCGSGSSNCLTYSSADIYRAFYDAVVNSDAPNHSSPTINLYDPSKDGAPANTLGTIDIAAQYINTSGTPVTASNGSSYLYDSSTVPIPTNASGLRATVSWPQQTYFGVAIGWKTYVVSARAAYLVQVTHPSQVVLAPFAVWWDPPWGPCQAQQLISSTPPDNSCQPNANTYGVPPQTLCRGVSWANTPPFPCMAQYNANPYISYPYGPPLNTQVIIFSNQYARDTGTSLASAGPDPDYQLGSNDFKGYFGYTGAQATCLDTYVNVTGNGNNGSNAYSALQASLAMIPGSTKGLASFALADKAIKSGSVQIFVYDSVPLLVDMAQVNASPNGPWYGTVTNMATTSASTCSGSAPSTGNYLFQPTVLQ